MTESKRKKRQTIKNLSLVVAERLLETNYFDTMRDMREILYYNEQKGVYEPAESFIDEQVEKLAPDDVSKHVCSEVRGRIERRTFVERQEFDKDANILNLRNGLFNLETGELKPHTPHKLSRIQLPIRYDKNARAPRFEAFLAQVIPEEQKREALLEGMAYNFFPDCSFEKAFIFYGEGSNGKTVLLKVITELLGKSNVSHVSLHDLATERFAKASLDGKIANIYYDLSDEDIHSTGVIKQVVSGERMEAETKFGKRFPMIPRAKLWLSCNKLPDVPKDKSNAWYRRWLIFDFKTMFGKGQKASADKNLWRKLTTQDELSGIFNMLLPRFKKLQQQEEFTFEPTVEQQRKEYSERADDVQAFMDAEMETDHFETCEKTTEVYSEYVKFCFSKKWPPKSDRTFSAVFEAKTGAARDHLLEYGDRRFGVQEHIWRGVRFRVRKLSDAFAGKTD